jgi:hypothetical protein
VLECASKLIKNGTRKQLLCHGRPHNCAVKYKSLIGDFFKL